MMPDEIMTRILRVVNDIDLIKDDIFSMYPEGEERAAIEMKIDDIFRQVTLIKKYRGMDG